jgi:hypothetical protein
MGSCTQARAGRRGKHHGRRALVGQRKAFRFINVDLEADLKHFSKPIANAVLPTAQRTLF